MPHVHDSYTRPDLDALRNEALAAGAIDPMSLRFSVVEYDKFSGEKLGVTMENMGFTEAVEKTARLIEKRSESHFCLEPTGFVQ